MLLATVSSVNQVPSTQSQMMAVLGNDALVQSLSSSGTIVEVRLKLLPDKTTPSGYQWTSAQGPPVSLWSGTLSEGNVITSQVRPIDLALVR
jgi:HlyD family secretion protein